MQDTNITTADYFDAMRTTETFLPSLRSLDISLLPAAVQAIARLIGQHGFQLGHGTAGGTVHPGDCLEQGAVGGIIQAQVFLGDLDAGNEARAQFIPGHRCSPWVWRPAAALRASSITSAMALVFFMPRPPWNRTQTGLPS